MGTDEKKDGKGKERSEVCNDGGRTGEVQDEGKIEVKGKRGVRTRTKTKSLESLDSGGV